MEGAGGSVPADSLALPAPPGPRLGPAFAPLLLDTNRNPGRRAAASPHRRRPGLAGEGRRDSRKKRDAAALAGALGALALAGASWRSLSKLPSLCSAPTRFSSPSSALLRSLAAARSRTRSQAVASWLASIAASAHCALSIVRSIVLESSPPFRLIKYIFMNGASRSPLATRRVGPLGEPHPALPPPAIGRRQPSLGIGWHRLASAGIGSGRLPGHPNRTPPNFGVAGDAEDRRHYWDWRRIFSAGSKARVG